MEIYGYFALRKHFSLTVNILGDTRLKIWHTNNPS